jgi:deazaflavin-dependent oxidoreductase (nitroreductase family)
MLNSSTQSAVTSARPSMASDGPKRGFAASYRALIRRFGGTRWFAWLGIHVLTRVDKWLFPRFHGHFVSAGPPIFPMLQLTTTGRRSGLPRSTPLVYLAEGDTLIVVASNWGQAHHPDWSANLLDDPHATVEIKGRRRTVTARLATKMEKQELFTFIARGPLSCRISATVSRSVHAHLLPDIPVCFSTASPGWFTRLCHSGERHHCLGSARSAGLSADRFHRRSERRR